MKIIQLAPTLNYGDAIGNDILALNKLMINKGYNTGIYAENISDKLKHKAYNINKINHLKSDDIIIYHLSIGTNLNFQLPKYKCKKIVIYHNITPPEFFSTYDINSYNKCKLGLEGVKFLSDKVDYCLTDSEFNKQDLINMGYNMKIDVLPILIPFEDYDQPPNVNLINKYNDNFVNILFTGRVVPNKKFEDIISIFYYYKKYINKNSRLIFVGSYDQNDAYYKRLSTFINKLNLSDVIFTGHINFKDILSYYHLADVFVCMSEHEGFCVPLVEAMYFDIPIIAYDSCAVSETLGNSGIVIQNKNYIEAAELINMLITNLELKNKVIASQKQRLRYFSRHNIEDKFIKYINEFINK